MRRDPPLTDRQRALLVAIRRNTLTRNQKRDLIYELGRLWLPKEWAAEVRRFNRAEEADIAAFMIRLMKDTTGSVHDAKLKAAQRLNFHSVEAMDQSIKRAKQEEKRVGDRYKKRP
jgi:hypothetical protein